MPEIEKKKNWFGLITNQVLEQAGPAKIGRKGIDLTTGQPSPPPGDNLTQDVYEKAEQQARK